MDGDELSDVEVFNVKVFGPQARGDDPGFLVFIPSFLDKMFGDGHACVYWEDEIQIVDSLQVVGGIGDGCGAALPDDIIDSIDTVTVFWQVEDCFFGVVCVFVYRESQSQRLVFRGWKAEQAHTIVVVGRGNLYNGCFRVTHGISLD